MPAPDFVAEIAALEAAAATGELTVEDNGERVTYRSMKDLLAALEYFRGRARAAQPTSVRRSATTVAAYEPE